MIRHSSQALYFKCIEKFGFERLYPDCEKSVALCELIKSKTFLRRNFKYLTTLGFSIMIDDELIKMDEEND